MNLVKMAGLIPGMNLYNAGLASVAASAEEVAACTALYQSLRALVVKVGIPGSLVPEDPNLFIKLASSGPANGALRSALAQLGPFVAHPLAQNVLTSTLGPVIAAQDEKSLMSLMGKLVERQLIPTPDEDVSLPEYISSTLLPHFAGKLAPPSVAHDDGNHVPVISTCRSCGFTQVS